MFNRGNNSGGRGPKRFGGKSSGRPGFSKDRYSEKPEMHKATCDKCGTTCEVPFRPTSGKPVYCNNCFRKEGPQNADRPAPKRFERKFSSNDDARGGTDQYKEQFAILNSKLDKILKALSEDSDESLD